MIVKDVTELTITAILERGVPNRECIALRANEFVNMGQFGLMLGRYGDGKSATPYFDNLSWFGDGLVKSGDWIFVYTGSGTASKRPATNGTNEICSLFWGKPTTIFAESSIAPILFRVDAVDVLAPPGNLPQHPVPQNG